MRDKELFGQKIKELSICVLVPTYNNGKTLSAIIDSILTYTSNIIVVDDGSTDNTKDILRKYPAIEIISYEKNAGKGLALRKGFTKAIEKGYRYAITIDSDGQHRVDELPVFIEKAEKEPDTLIVGARNMSSEGIPAKSSFGHRFSNFWFTFETGIDFPDTQSGYRLYPLELLKNMKFYTVKYEFEIEILVRAVWKGIKINWAPIRVIYAPKEERVSHFRPFIDFGRVSVLNSLLVFMAIFYFRPLLFFRNFSKENIRKLYREQVINNPQTNTRIILSVMLGAFMGVAPVWGYQIVLTLIIAQFLGLNKIIAVIVSNISLPPMIPLIIWASFRLGALLVKGKPLYIVLSRNINLKMIWENISQYVAGALVLGFLLSIAFGSVTFLMLHLLQKKKKNYKVN